jgi:hypothetical protein
MFKKTLDQIDAETGGRFQRNPEFDDEGLEGDADTHRNAPKPHPECLFGLIGEIARAGSKDTEANPYAIAASALAYFGVAVGRGPYFPIGDDCNHARLNFVHVGRSSRGRKGTAKKLVINRIAKAVKDLNVPLAPQIHSGGLSSREGLALMIHDGLTQGRDEIPPIEDKRLLVVESEFANVLHQNKRDGNTLSTALRDAWDGTSIQPATKSNRVGASNPHIGVLADITPSELRSLISSRELTNGFANRFIFFWAEGGKINPFPKQTPNDVVESFAHRAVDVLLFADANRHAERDVKRMTFSQDAEVLYDKLYRGELRDRSAGEQITGLLARRSTTLIRLAMIFALTDRTLTIEVAHIRAAMAWVRYWVDSVKYIFQSALDELATELVSEAGDQLVQYLKLHSTASRSEINRLCFKGHLSKINIDRTIDELLCASPPLIEVVTVPRINGNGSPTKFYKLTADSADSANCEHSCGLQPESAPLEDVRNLRNVEADFAEFADVARTPNPAPNRVDIQTSLNSQNPQTDLEKTENVKEYAEDS